MDPTSNAHTKTRKRRSRVRTRRRRLAERLNRISPPASAADEHEESLSPMRPRWKVSREYSLMRRYAELPEGDHIKQLVDRMKAYFFEYQHAHRDRYWHRKSGHVVLAVLGIRHRGRLCFVKGVNSEISLPSGSICAERAAISAALSEHLSLSRRDFFGIAVLSLSNLNPIRPCGVCKEWIKKIEAGAPTFTVVTFTSISMEEILENSAMTVCEDVMDDISECIRGDRWNCKCGFHLNSSTQLYCFICKQPRYRFKQHLQTQRVDLLHAIERAVAHPESALSAAVNHAGLITAQSAADSDLTLPLSNASTPESDFQEEPHQKTTRPSHPDLQQLIGPRMAAGSGGSQYGDKSSAPRAPLQLPPCRVHHTTFLETLSKRCQRDVDQVAKTLRDLKSLRFIERVDPEASSISTRTPSESFCTPESNTNADLLVGSTACSCGVFRLTKLGEDFLRASPPNHFDSPFIPGKLGEARRQNLR